MKLLTVKELAQKIRSTVGSVYSQKYDKTIPPWCVISIGNKKKQRLLFDEEAVEHWLNSCRLAPLPSTP